MSGFSGKKGKVVADGTQIAEITKWSFKPTSNNPDWASSDTNGFKDRVAGVKDGGGDVDFKYDVDDPFFTVIDVGTEVTLQLFVDETRFYEVPSVIDDNSIDVDIDKGDVVGGTAKFSTRGEWTNPV